MKKGVIVSVKIRFRADGSGVAILAIDNGDVVAITGKQAAQYVKLSRSNASMLLGSTIEYELFAPGDKLFDGSDYKGTTDGLQLMKTFDIALTTKIASFLYAIEHGAPVMC